MEVYKKLLDTSWGDIFRHAFKEHGITLWGPNIQNALPVELNFLFSEDSKSTFETTNIPLDPIQAQYQAPQVPELEEQNKKVDEILAAQKREGRFTIDPVRGIQSLDGGGIEWLTGNTP